MKNAFFVIALISLFFTACGSEATTSNPAITANAKVLEKYQSSYCAYSDILDYFLVVEGPEGKRAFVVVSETVFLLAEVGKPSSVSGEFFSKPANNGGALIVEKYLGSTGKYARNLRYYVILEDVSGRKLQEVTVEEFATHVVGDSITVK
jgi:hypothetical protein